MRNSFSGLVFALVSFIMPFQSSAQETERARDLGVEFRGVAGPDNAITDVVGVEVGHETIVEGSGRLEPGKGPVRTGVTAILPRGAGSTDPVFASWFSLNGSGEMTGTTWLDERGLLDGPILITNTHSVGIARDAAVKWMVENGWPALWHAPVVAETYDGLLNDINGFHVTQAHVLKAINSASAGPVSEGNVGGGTGMMCNRFKGGIGTSSREFDLDGETFTVGVLVQCNYGRRRALKSISGVDVTDVAALPMPCYGSLAPRERRFSSFEFCDQNSRPDPKEAPDGSIIVIIATNAPLLPHQLKRLARRPSLALGRLGAISQDGSGDLFLAFSTAKPPKLTEDEVSLGIQMYPNNQLTLPFEATVQATEEAILNALVAAKTMTGADDVTVFELPEDYLRSKFSRSK